MRQFEPQTETHDCEFEEPSYAICEDMAVIVHWRCTYQPHTTHTDHERDETYYEPTGPQCEQTRYKRFELDHTIYRGKRCDGDWRKWCASRDDAYSALDATEIDPLDASECECVVEWGIGWGPDGSHGRIVLEKETEHGLIMAVYQA
jgi:hypothetical protein